MKLKVRITESYRTWSVRDSIEIDTDDYPELNGMSEEEMISYIETNNEEMAASTPDSYCNSLWEELQDQDVVRDKILDEETEVLIEKIED